MVIESWFQVLVTIACTAIASSGFWTFVQKRNEKKDVKTKVLIGLGHDRIISLGVKYISRGWITEDEYENLNDYLYKPYKELGGNGSAARIMQEVSNLPIKHRGYNGYSEGGNSGE